MKLSNVDSKLLAEIKVNTILAKHFFDVLDSPKAINILAEAGIFSKAPKNMNGQGCPRWFAFMFLVKVLEDGSLQDKELKSLHEILKSPIELNGNYHAAENILEVYSLLPINESLEYIDEAGKLISKVVWFPHEILSRWINKLIKNKDYDAAVKLFSMASGTFFFKNYTAKDRRSDTDFSYLYPTFVKSINSVALSACPLKWLERLILDAQYLIQTELSKYHPESEGDVAGLEESSSFSWVKAGKIGSGQDTYFFVGNVIDLLALSVEEAIHLNLELLPNIMHMLQSREGYGEFTFKRIQLYVLNNISALNGEMNKLKVSLEAEIGIQDLSLIHI